MPLRLMSRADLATVLAINNAAVPAVGELDDASLHHLVDVSELALVATAPGPHADHDGANSDSADPDDVVGFCIVLRPSADYHSVNYRWFCDRYEDFVYLDRVAITPGAQGHGLGRALYEFVAASTTAPWFCLEVNLRPRNDPSLAFHERLGFAEVGQQETDYGALVSLQARRLPF